MPRLSVLADTTFREALRLFRLYHAQSPPGISPTRRGRIRVAADTALFPERNAARIRLFRGHSDAEIAQIKDHAAEYARSTKVRT